QREAVADQHPAEVDGGPGVGGQPVEPVAEVALDRDGIGPGQPAAGPPPPGPPGGVGGEVARAGVSGGERPAPAHPGGGAPPQPGWGDPPSSSSSRPSRATSSAAAAITLGSSRGRMTSWTGSPWRRRTTFQVAEPRPATGNTSRSGSGRSTPSPRWPSRMS